MEFFLAYMVIGIISVALIIRSEVKNGRDVEVKVNDLGYIPLISLLWPILVCGLLGEAWGDSNLSARIKGGFKNFGNIKLLSLKGKKDKK